MDSYIPGEFATLEEAQEALRKTVFKEGFCTAIRNKKPTAKEPRSVFFVCTKAGTWIQDRKFAETTTTVKRRKTTTSKTCCKWSLWVYYKPRGWVFGPAQQEHNHPLLEAVAHRAHRRAFVDEKREQIISLHKAGFRAAEILEHLRWEWPHPGSAPVINRDIYNVIALHQAQQLAAPGPDEDVADADEDIADAAAAEEQAS